MHSLESDYIFINEMETSCHVGITEDERAFPQLLIISVKMHLSLKEAGKSDNLLKTIDYASVISKIKSHLSSKIFNLVEAISEDIGAICLKYPSIQSVEVQVDKKVFPGIKSVGARIYRTKN